MCISQNTIFDNHIYISNAQPIHMDIITEYISHVIWLFQWCANFAHGCSLWPRSYRRSHVRPRSRGLSAMVCRLSLLVLNKANRQSVKDYVMQSNESLGVFRLIFPSPGLADGLWLAESTQVGHGLCHTFIESCPQGVLWTVRVVIQPESSGWLPPPPPQIFLLPLWTKYSVEIVLHCLLPWCFHALWRFLMLLSHQNCVCWHLPYVQGEHALPERAHAEWLPSEPTDKWFHFNTIKGSAIHKT